MIQLTIDGRPVEAEKGMSILTAARRAGINIPTLCFMEGIIPDGSCRFCVVEIESRGRKKVDTACTATCSEGDIIETNSPAVRDSRRKTLDLLLSDHCVDCFSCEANGDCKLQTFCYDYGLEMTTYSGEKNNAPVDDTNEYFKYDPARCILCHRCVNTCNEIVGRGAINTMNRGFLSVIGAPFDDTWGTSDCVSCGNCVQACPTGALSMKRRKNYRLNQVEKRVLTTCPKCALGCRLELFVKNGKIVDAVAAEGPANHGLLCAKGRNQSFDFVHSHYRIKYPMIKDKETGEFGRASWDEALDLIASKFKEIREKYGKNSLAGIIGPENSNEDAAMLRKMVKDCFGPEAFLGIVRENCALSEKEYDVLGAKGRGVTPLEAKCNEQGVCDMGASVKDYQACISAMVSGDVKGLYICGDDPAEKDPDIRRADKALRKLEFLVVQDIFMTETAYFADVILPGLSYAEKDGTFTNADHRIQEIRKAVDLNKLSPRYDLRPETEVIEDIMARMA